MNIKPVETVDERQLNNGLNYVLADGLSAEAMVVFTSGTFLTAMAIHMGASNFQLGLFAALPTFTTIFQLVSIWLVQKFNNRKLVCAGFNLLARLPLIAIGIMPVFFRGTTTIQVLLLLLFFQHIFGDIAGASWNAWMKDLIPGERLGSFFSRRTRMAQTLNVTLSIATAMGIDYVKAHYPAFEVTAYTTLFLAGGALGMVSVFLLFRTPEPVSRPVTGNTISLFIKTLKHRNFRRLLVFNSVWAFALNLATPFFAIFMIKTIGLPLSFVIGLGVVSQLSGILSLNLWGRYSDRFSNKTIINICAPLYVICIIALAFTGMPQSRIVCMGMLILIYTISGLSTAGINLALSNIGIKLAPKHNAIVYLTAKNMFVAFFSTIAPVIGGLLADFFAHHALTLNIPVAHDQALTLIALRGWNYFFIGGGLLALLSLRLLANVSEPGETNKNRVIAHMRIQMRKKVRNGPGRETLRRGYASSKVIRRKIRSALKPNSSRTISRKAA